MKNRTLALALCTVFGAMMATGCMHHRYYTESNVVPTETPDYESNFTSHFVFGLVTPASSDVNVSEVCPNGMRYAEDKVTFLNGLVSGLTFNLYNPTKVRVWCN